MNLDIILRNIETHIDALENGLTLKKSYTDELQELDQFESDIMNVRYFGTSTKANDLLRRINHISSWIKEEVKHDIPRIRKTT